jgi:hypothetical protein
VADAKKLAVLIEDNGVAEAKVKEDFHDGEGVCCSVGVGDRFHGRKRAHTATCNEVMRGSLEPGFLTGLIAVDMKHHHWRFDWKIVDELAGFPTCGVGQSTTGASVTHPGDVHVHMGPIIAEGDAMEGPCRIEMAANGIAVECNENDIA